MVNVNSTHDDARSQVQNIRRMLDPITSEADALAVEFDARIQPAVSGGTKFCRLDVETTLGSFKIELDYESQPLMAEAFAQGAEAFAQRLQEVAKRLRAAFPMPTSSK